MNIEAANDRLAAQLGLTAGESERLGGVAGDLYANAYGDSLEQVNAAVGAVVTSIAGMRDASSADVETITAKVLDLASVFELDVARAAQVAGQAVTTGLADDATQAMDLLTASLQAVPAAVREDLLDALDEYGPFMASIGLEGEAAFGLLVKAAEDGMYGIDKTGDALKEFTIRATDMSALSKTAYDTLGLSQEDMTRKLLAGGETAAGAFDQIIGGLSGIQDPAAQSQAALALFGTPLEDLNVSEIPAFLAGLSDSQDALGETAGAADEMGKTLADNAATSIEGYKRSLQQTAQNALDSVGPLAAVAGAAAAFGPAALGIIGPIAQVVAARAALTAATVAQTGATTAATTAQTGLNLAMLANPMVLVTGLVVALVAAVVVAYRESETFRDIVNGAFATIKQGGGDAVGFLIDGFALLVDAWLLSADAIVSGAATALGWVPGLGDKLKAANKAFDDMAAGIKTTLDDAAQKAYGFGEKAGANTASGIGTAAPAAYNAGAGLASDLGRGVNSGATTARNAGAGVGANAALGVIEGLNAYAPAVAATAQRIAASVGRAMATGLQERSPSQVTRRIGQYAGEGLELGLLDWERPVADASSVLARAAVPTISGTSPALSADSGGVTGRFGAGAGGTTVIVQGNVGYDPDELAERIETRRRDSAAVYQLTALAVGVG